MADSILLIAFVNHIFAAHHAYGFVVHTALENLVFTNIDEAVPGDIHSEYYFGKCGIPDRRLTFKDTKTYDELKGRVVVRGTLVGEDHPNTKKAYTDMPRCVYVRARSKYTDVVRFHAFKFNICLCNIIIQHTNRIFNHPYYEWYLPVEQKEGITWELFFYV